MDNHFYYNKDPTPPPPYYTPVSTATPAHNVYSSSEYSPAPRTFYPAPLQIPATSTVNVIHARQVLIIATNLTVLYLTCIANYVQSYCDPYTRTTK
jgi:hypothetical protein